MKSRLLTLLSIFALVLMLTATASAQEKVINMSTTTG